MWDVCAALLTRSLLRPLWLPSPSREATQLFCIFHSALPGLFYLHTFSVSGARFPSLLSEDAAQQGKSLPLALSSVFSSGGWTRYWNPLSPASSASRDSRKATFRSVILEGPLLHRLYFFSYLKEPSAAGKRSQGERRSQRL